MAGRFCVRQRECFSDQLDGERLSWWRRLMMRMHLSICAPCRRVQRSLETTRDALRDLRDRDPS